MPKECVYNAAQTPGPSVRFQILEMFRDFFRVRSMFRSVTLVRLSRCEKKHIVMTKVQIRIFQFPRVTYVSLNVACESIWLILSYLVAIMSCVNIKNTATLVFDQENSSSSQFAEPRNSQPSGYEYFFMCLFTAQYTKPFEMSVRYDC